MTRLRDESDTGPVPTTVSVYDAKTQLSRLLARVEAGEEILISRNGRPVARLAPLPEPAPRAPGAWRGRVVIRDDFDTFTPDDAADWYGP